MKQRFKKGTMSWYTHAESDCHFVEVPGFMTTDGCSYEVGEARDDSEEDFERAVREDSAKWNVGGIFHCTGCGWKGAAFRAYRGEDEPPGCPICG